MREKTQLLDLLNAKLDKKLKMKFYTPASKFREISTLTSAMELLFSKLAATNFVKNGLFHLLFSERWQQMNN